MRKILCALTIALISFPMAVQAEAVPGKPAPAFEVKDSTGKTQNLTAYKGIGHHPARIYGYEQQNT